MRQTGIVVGAMASVLSATLLVGCAATPLHQSASAPAKPSGTARVSAVYLEPTGTAQLDPGDLARHPQVLVVHTQDELKSKVASGVAIWIDKGAVRTVDAGWLHKLTYGSVIPVAVIGYNNSMYAFREKLPIAGLIGGYVDWKRVRLEPGFAVYSFRRFIHGGGIVGYLRGYDQTPTVQGVLAATDPILGGRFPTQSTPTTRTVPPGN